MKTFRDDDYLAWKGWSDGDAFGMLARGDSQYFTRELRDSVRGRRVHDVLEVGFGNGAFLAYARGQGYRVVGTELLPHLVQAARDAGFESLPAAELDTLDDESFDLIVAFDVFEHIPPEESVEFLATLARKLRSSGAIVVRFPNADSWVGSAFQNGDPTHVNAIGVLKLFFYAQSADLAVDAYRAVSRRGFSTSIVHGVHRLTSAPLIAISSAIKKAMYLPGLPVVLSTGNVVSVLTKRAAPRQP